LQYENDGDSLGGSAGFASPADLDAFFPNGTYTLEFRTVHDGLRSFALDLLGDSYPNAPQLLNLSAAQALVCTQAFTLAWAPFVGGTSNDVIMVEIANDFGDTVSATKENGGDLNGTVTSLVLPANALYPGRTYTATLRFVKIVDVDSGSYSDVFSVAAYGAETKFPLRTAGEPIRPALEVLPAPPGSIHLRITGEPGRIYTVEATENLGNPYGWYPIRTETAWDGAFEVFEYGTAFNLQRFYRVKEGWPDNPGR
jgi:hypothetical protein